MTSMSVRPAGLGDISQMGELLLWGAQQREASDSLLWPVARDARASIEGAIRTDLERSDQSLHKGWFLAEAAGRLLGITHSMVVPVPPIYDVGERAPGLLHDDCVLADSVPAGTAEALLAATEAALVAAGAGAMIASCPASSPWRPFYERHGYRPVTHYLAKSGFQVRASPAAVRAALSEDAPAITRLGARHRQMLSQLNPLFWRIHPEADRRWEMFLRYMMTLQDREVLVAEATGSLHGYVVAQPASPLFIPTGHDLAHVGVIDDYYDLDFTESRTLQDGGLTAAGLLSSAESVFASRDFAAALVVCPAAWTSKAKLLEQNGYRTAKLWMFRP